MSVEPISPEQARKILDAAIAERLGADWQQRDEWVLVTGTDFMARLTHDKTNLDFYVDLLGNVSVEEKTISMAQDFGGQIALAFLILSFVIAALLARLAGVI
jgi:hypothetical protein